MQGVRVGKVVGIGLLVSFFLIGCSSTPIWSHATATDRQFYNDDELCIKRAERTMGNAGNYEPDNDNTYSNAGAAIGNAFASVIAKRRAMGVYKDCMRSMGYREEE
jgi:hypothetical protein